MSRTDKNSFVFNLEILKKSRKAPRPGDIFVLKPIDHPYYFGRVIRADLEFLGLGNVLSYVYDVTSDTKHSIPTLSRERMLIAPVVTSREPWARGFFEIVAHRELHPDDTLETHCFRVGSTNVYRDADGARLTNPVEPIGTFGLTLPRGIDRRVSEALGISRPTAKHRNSRADRVEFGETSADCKDGEHAVVIHLKPWPEDGKAVPCDVMELEERLIDAVQLTGVGQYDGHGIGTDEIEFFLYGPDAERLFTTVEAVLGRWQLSGYVVKRYGGPQAHEVRVEL